MIFARRHKETLFSKIRNLIWPKMGWKRTVIYYKHRVLRIPHSTHDIALGMASGCVISWTPTFPFQILQCFIFCKIVRANFPAALLGTLFGNPWTFPILFTIAYHVGHFIFELTGLGDLLDILIGDTLLFKENGFGMEKFLPTLVGGYVMAIVTFPVCYYAFFYLITAGRASRRVVTKRVSTIIEHRHERKEERREERAERKKQDEAE